MPATVRHVMHHMSRAMARLNAKLEVLQDRGKHVQRTLCMRGQFGRSSMIASALYPANKNVVEQKGTANG